MRNCVPPLPGAEEGGTEFVQPRRFTARAFTREPETAIAANRESVPPLPGAEEGGTEFVQPRRSCLPLRGKVSAKLTEGGVVRLNTPYRRCAPLPPEGEARVARQLSLSNATGFTGTTVEMACL